MTTDDTPKPETSTAKSIEDMPLRQFYRMAAAAGMLNLDRTLVAAAHGGQAGRVQALIEAGANVQLMGEFDSGAVFEDPICAAVASGSAETVRVLLAAGADVHTYRDHPIRDAAKRGHAEVVQALIDGGADLQASWYGGIYTPLENAVRYGHPDVIRVLLKAGATPSDFISKEKMDRLLSGEVPPSRKDYVVPVLP